MAAIPAIGNAINGMQRATRTLDQVAAHLAGADPAAADLPTDMVSLKTSEIAFAANVAVVKAADEMTQTTLGALLDAKG